MQQLDYSTVYKKENNNRKLGLGSGLIRVRIRARMVRVSYIMRTWRWEEVSRCDKFSTPTRFTYPGMIVGCVDLGGWLHTETVYLPAGNHPLQ